MMKYLFFLLVCLPCVFSIEHPEATLPFLKYCKHFNYPVEVHYIKCDDGYINTFFRVQKKNTTIRKLGLTPIFLQHGLLDSSDTWILND
jgi:hypothetical protein